MSYFSTARSMDTAVRQWSRRAYVLYVRAHAGSRCPWWVARDHASAACPSKAGSPPNPARSDQTPVHGAQRRDYTGAIELAGRWSSRLLPPRPRQARHVMTPAGGTTDPHPLVPRSHVRIYHKVYMYAFACMHVRTYYTSDTGYYFLYSGGGSIRGVPFSFWICSREARRGGAMGGLDRREGGGGR